ncbi:M56 family metallopeptidase [Frankia sp. Mgl5]|uniref:M56 family metallopeptidase n=1 Tax=Frankia sp. Mgl5 TaxID=2933793 RepID=UPI00200F38A5|nr:M56 family metallopeptidase [Frankia sp. Mgl5]
MRYMVWLPLIANVVVAVSSPTVTRRLSYRVKPAVLTAVAVVAAGCWLWCLTLVASSFLARLPEVAGRVRGAPASHVLAESPPPAVGAAAAVLVTAATGMLLVAAVRTGRDLARAERLVRQAPPGQVMVVPGWMPDACAVGGITGGRIVITTGMLDCLDPAEQDAVLAHERAHLAGGHHWLRITVACCAAVSPPLRRFPALLEAACERWADEHAARATERRRVLARALSKAALTTLRSRRGGPAEPSPPPATACGFRHGTVTERIAALLEDAPGITRMPATPPITIIIAVSVMIGTAAHAGMDCFALLRAIF